MKKITLIRFFLYSIQHGFTEVIKVGLEPFPPLITKIKTGYSIKLLKAIEKVTDLKFGITIMSYNQAKKI